MNRMRINTRESWQAKVMSDDSRAAEDACNSILRWAPEMYQTMGVQFGTQNLIVLDELGIYGENIVTLFNKVCSGQTGKLVTLLQAYDNELGVSKEKLLNSIKLGGGSEFNFEELKRRVQMCLTGFQPHVAWMKGL